MPQHLADHLARFTELKDEEVTKSLCYYFVEYLFNRLNPAMRDPVDHQMLKIWLGLSRDPLRYSAALNQDLRVALEDVVRKIVAETPQPLLQRKIDWATYLLYRDMHLNQLVAGGMSRSTAELFLAKMVEERRKQSLGISRVSGQDYRQTAVNAMGVYLREAGLDSEVCDPDNMIKKGLGVFKDVDIAMVRLPYIHVPRWASAIISGGSTELWEDDLAPYSPDTLGREAGQHDVSFFFLALKEMSVALLEPGHYLFYLDQMAVQEYKSGYNRGASEFARKAFDLYSCLHTEKNPLLSEDVYLQRMGIMSSIIAACSGVDTTVKADQNRHT